MKNSIKEILKESAFVAGILIPYIGLLFSVYKPKSVWHAIGIGIGLYVCIKLVRWGLKK